MNAQVIALSNQATLNVSNINWKTNLKMENVRDPKWQTIFLSIMFN